MRKHSVRKWIHAILDMLPLVVIPIFAIYSHRHSIDSYSVQAEETKVVNFNQLRSNDYISGSFVGDVTLYQSIDVTYFDYVNGHKYLTRVNYQLQSDVSLQFRLGNPSYSGYSFYLQSSSNHIDYIGEYVLSPSENYNNMMYFQSFTNGSLNLTYYDLNVFDLTYMFGEGNEPTIEEFNSWYSDDFYEYNTGTKELLKTGNYINYDDTDIGSQFMYQMYNVTNKYFNFNKVGTFQDIYNWFETNLFGGTSPMSFFIVWNIILYEFIMDLIFLTYMLFMFIIDFAEHMIDCFFDKSYRGGR